MATAVISQQEINQILASLGGAELVEDMYPLASLQRGLLFHTLYDPTAYVNSLRWCLCGKLDAEAFERAWQHVVERHTIFRTAFVGEGLKIPLQAVLKRAALPFTWYDWRDVPSAEWERRFSTLQGTECARGFELSKPPLMRVSVVRMSEEEYWVLWTSHHVLSDGWSFPIILDEIAAAYGAFSRRESPRLPAPRPYRDYIAWLQRQDVSAAETYWRDRLEGFTGPTALGVDRVAQGVEGERYAQYSYRFSVDLKALEELARRCSVTINVLVQGAWAWLLSRYSGSEDVVFGVTISGRPAELPDIENRVGLFINTLPFRTTVPGAVPACEWFQQLATRLSELIEYQYSSLVDVRRWSTLTPGPSLFESGFVFENYPGTVGRVMDGAAPLRVLSFDGTERPHFPLALQFGAGEGLLLKVIYDPARFDRLTIERLAGHLERFLAGVVQRPERSLSSIEVLSEFERHRVLVEWNETGREYPRESSIGELFAEQAAKRPDALAVVYAGQSLSYGELDRRANQLAHHLGSLGVGPESIVGVCMERSLEMVVGLLGILKAGGAYLPLDPQLPEQRLTYLMADARARVVLTQAGLADRWAHVAVVRPGGMKLRIHAGREIVGPAISVRHKRG